MLHRFQTQAIYSHVQIHTCDSSSQNHPATTDTVLHVISFTVYKRIATSRYFSPLDPSERVGETARFQRSLDIRLSILSRRTNGVEQSYHAFFPYIVYPTNPVSAASGFSKKTERTTRHRGKSARSGAIMTVARRAGVWWSDRFCIEQYSDTT